MDTSMADSLPSSPPNSQDFALSGKIMLSAIIILLFVVILIVCLHIYARWYVLRARRRRGVNNSRRRNRLVFFIDSENAAPHGPTIQNHGLDEAVLKSLPVFTYSSESYKDPIECAVCLSEFEENEKGRNLPKCSHSFHIECIDMWFHSHSTCPLCRSPVEPVVEPVVDFVVEPERCDVGPSSLSGSTSFRARRKPVIEIPTRGENEFVAAGAGVSSSSSPMPLTPSFKSPISRVMSLSFKRIIGRERRGGGGSSPSGGAGSSAAELDIERGKESVM